MVLSVASLTTESVSSMVVRTGLDPVTTQSARVIESFQNNLFSVGSYEI